MIKICKLRLIENGLNLLIDLISIYGVFIIYGYYGGCFEYYIVFFGLRVL